ncbi:response regulator [Piscinibacter sp. XHJ-5]|uniref:response regulator n=1 Tax=Piscinibacter sp. XHJ-5 TaxID=3037797 RepID=UPI0024532079|nr:response regulator [Piscinibacter sp. XHJ-5]
MKILMIDDEEHVLMNHRIKLRDAGHSVKGITRLDQALQVLEASFSGPPGDGFDLVLIDLLLPHHIPPQLLGYYQGIATRVNNQGQALGQWLWEKAGAHREPGRPIHCYIANIPGFYCDHTLAANQEFSGSRAFILDKTKMMPSQMAAALSSVDKLWGPMRCPAGGAAP